jgi:hypothetical protein
MNKRNGWNSGRRRLVKKTYFTGAGSDTCERETTAAIIHKSGLSYLPGNEQLVPDAVIVSVCLPGYFALVKM